MWKEMATGSHTTRAALRPFLALILVLAALPAATASGETHANTRVIASLNAERAEHGLPPVTENPAWSAKCKTHNAFEARNGVIAHIEDPALAGYSAAGAWAGEHSVLGLGSWANGNPFATAPIHLIQLMSPLLARTGVDESKGHVCMTTWPGYAFERFNGKSPRIFSVPGDGATGVPAAERGRELPFTPADVVGLHGRSTGFNLMVYATGVDGATLASASLTGPAGNEVALRTIDTRNDKLGPYMPPGSAFLIPVKPLAPGTRYTAHVTFDAEGTTLRRTWQFTTASGRGESRTAP
jgi:hypothetical protein